MALRPSPRSTVKPFAAEGPRPVPSPVAAVAPVATTAQQSAVASGDPVAQQALDATPEGRRERHRRETFERLVRAAREIMFNRGFNDITVQDITDAADVGKGTFFNYFRSKEHVVSRVHEYNRRAVMHAVDQVRSAQQSVPEALTSILMSLLCPAGGEWLTYQTNTMRALALNPEVRLLVSQELDKTRQSHETLLSIGQEQGAVRKDLPANDLAVVQQTYLAGLTVLFWIHSTTPTPELVTDVTNKFVTLIEAPKVAAAPAPAPRAARPAVRRKPAATRRAKPKATARRATSKRR